MMTRSIQKVLDMRDHPLSPKGFKAAALTFASYLFPGMRARLESHRNTVDGIVSGIHEGDVKAGQIRLEVDAYLEERRSSKDRETPNSGASLDLK